MIDTDTSTVTTIPDAPTAVEQANLNQVIAEQARERSTSELRTTAMGGAMNALLLYSQFPRLHWLAAAFAAVAGYGAWGLADRALSAAKSENSNDPVRVVVFGLLRGVAGAGGWAAALMAIVWFMSAALGGLSIPGR